MRVIPNHVTNKLLFHPCTEKRFNEILADLQKEGAEPGSIDLGRIIPEPEGLFMGDLGVEEMKKYKDNNWYDWRIKHWNTKWNAYGFEPPAFSGDTVSRQTIWKENPQIILEGGSLNPEIKFIRTITTKQDRNPNSGNLYFESGIEGKSHFRYLTPRECLLFMGFTDEDYRNIVKCNPEVHKGSVLFPRDKIIRMAGNSIPVKLLEGVFYQILLLDKKI